MSEIKNLIKLLLEYATKQGADLHICPKSAPFVRLGGNKGVLQPVPDFETWALDLATVKTLIGELLTPEQKTELQRNKYLNFTMTHGELGRFRAYAYTQRGTHAITIHTLPFEVPDIKNMDLTHAAVDALNNIVAENKGLVIVAGDYFSGKSATLAALINLINENRSCHISTVENPIEYLHHHKKSMVSQKEIGADVSDLGAALQQIRHENPDIIALSELHQDYFLSVMELAEERLVLASVKTNQRNNDNALSFMGAFMKIAREELARNKLIEPFIPRPPVNIIFQQSYDKTINGELLTWERYKHSLRNEGLPVETIIFGRGAGNAEGN